MTGHGAVIGAPEAPRRAALKKSYRIRVYPNGAQRRMLDRWFGAACWIWNTALEVRSEAYRALGLRLTFVDFSRWLTQWKRTAGHEWLADVPATCLVQTLRNQETAFRRFFMKKARYPKYRRNGSMSVLRFQDIGVAWSRGILSLPKLGRLKVAETLPEIKQPDMVTLRRDAAGRYFVTFCADVEVDLSPVTGRAVGVDLGLTHFATLSNGEKIAAPKHYRNRLRYLRRQQRCLSHRQKGSNRREKQRARVARAHAKIAAQRQYAIHQLTTRLVREFDVICIEDLNVNGLREGMLSRSMQDAAFSEFRRQLEYKSSWYGRTVIACDRFFPSSKTCSHCSHKLDELRLDIRQWTCPKCGTAHDRDINAAKNILAAGMGQLGGGDRRDYCVDGRDACPDLSQAQVLPVEARSGLPHRAVAQSRTVSLGGV